MEMIYPVFLGNESIGEAKVTRQGLYYHIACRCTLSGEVVHRLVLKKDDKTENLGIPIPEGRFFTLTKKLPVSRVGEGTFRICAVPRQPQLDELFVPLNPDEPFAYVHRLNRAYLTRHEGQLGLVVKV